VTAVCAPPRHTVGGIFRQHGETYRELWRPTPLQERVADALAACRTEALGGYLDGCDVCDYRRVRFNPCRNRHCPGCGGHLAAEWVAERRAQVLPIGHYHLVFTLPSELRGLTYENMDLVYDSMLRCAGRVVVDVGRTDKGVEAQVGVTAVLHTWARDLSYHPHVHCIVTAGGLSDEGDEWRACPRKGYFAPRALLAARFRGALIASLTHAYRQGSLRFAGQCRDLATPGAFWRLRAAMLAKDWNVYAKAPFGDPETLFRYLGHYTHRIGISNGRIVSVTDSHVTFHTKDGGTVTLDVFVFMTRFLTHVLTKGFVKIRHYGLYAAACAGRLAVARVLLGAPPPDSDPEPPEPDDGRDEDAEPARCPACMFGVLVTTELAPFT